jgi:hypothetical protein
MRKYFCFYRFCYLVSILLLPVLLSSCMPSTIKHGVPPKVDKLNSLKIDVSTRSDVLVALGEPRGRGAAHFSNADALKYGVPGYYDLWFYEYAQVEYLKVQLKFLLVFISQNHYKGHFWFSSSELMEVER